MNCYSLTMSQFLDYLFGETKPPEWDDIYSEYIGLRENKSSLFILTLMKEIAYLKTKHYIIERACTTAAQVVSMSPEGMMPDISELIKVIKEYGFKGEYNVKNKSTFSRDIKIVLSQIKKLITTRQRKEEELEEYQKKHAGKELTRKDFNVWAITLGKYLGYRVDLAVTTVAEWCMIMNEYERYCEVENSKQNNILSYGGTKNR